MCAHTERFAVTHCESKNTVTDCDSQWNYNVCLGMCRSGRLNNWKKTWLFRYLIEIYIDSRQFHSDLFKLLICNTNAWKIWLKLISAWCFVSVIYFINLLVLPGWMVEHISWWGLFHQWHILKLNWVLPIDLCHWELQSWVNLQVRHHLDTHLFISTCFSISFAV